MNMVYLSPAKESKDNVYSHVTLSLITFAGFPAIRQLGLLNVEQTTELEAITHPSGIRLPFNTVTLLPYHTRFPISIGKCFSIFSG